MLISLGNLFWMTCAAFLTLSIFSFLYRDNPFYRFAEHLIVGVSAGYWIAILYHTSLTDLWIEPLGASIAAFGAPQGTFLGKIWMLIVNIAPGALGILMFSRFFEKTSWISRWPIAFTVGIGSGLALTASFQGYLLPQVSDTLRPLVNANNIVVFVGVIATLFYFYFSKEHKGALGTVSRVGIVFIMVAFGASFGYTVMARISLLIGRFYFLLHDWLPIIR